jgi:hypothetical protein
VLKVWIWKEARGRECLLALWQEDKSGISGARGANDVISRRDDVLEDMMQQRIEHKKAR